MAQKSFGELWNQVLLYAPGTPVPLAQQTVRNAYDKITHLHFWSELYQEGEHIVKTDYSTGTVSVLNGSVTATVNVGVVDTTWTNTMQLGVLTNQGYAPFYDIVSVNTTANTLTLDRNYDGVTSTNAQYIVSEFYIKFPEDLYAFDDIRDATRNWRLRRQFNQANYLDRIDARRNYAGTPILYTGATPLTSSGVSYPRLEFWPRPPSGTKLVYRYIKKDPLTSNSDVPLVQVLPEVIVWGALAELTLWPGTAERPNPYFNMDLHREYDKMFNEGLQMSILQDLERNQRQIIYADDDRGYPADARFIQEHGLA